MADKGRLLADKGRLFRNKAALSAEETSREGCREGFREGCFLANPFADWASGTVKGGMRD